MAKINLNYSNLNRAKLNYSHINYSHINRAKLNCVNDEKEPQGKTVKNRLKNLIKIF